MINKIVWTFNKNHFFIFYFYFDLKAYKSYTKKIEWVDENTINTALVKLSGIKIIINSPTGKELVSKNC